MPLQDEYLIVCTGGYYDGEMFEQSQWWNNIDNF